MEENLNKENQSNQETKSETEKSEKTNTDSSTKTYKKRPYYNRRPRFYNKQNAPQREDTAFKKLSIIVPLLNEEESIFPLAVEIKKVMRNLNIGLEVIFVDDGSTDNSLKVIKDFCRQDKRFKFLSFRKNYGKSAALHMGFKEATGDVIITMDADLQDDPNEIPGLLKKLEDGFDVVSGWKKVRHDPFIKKTSSKFFNFVTRLLSGIKIHDFNCGLKAYRKDVVENIKVYGELHRYIPVLADWQGFKISEIPVKHHSRRYGKTKFGISRFFRGFLDLITVIFATRYIKRPMHLFGFLGALTFLVGIVVNGYLTYLWVSGQQLSNRPMLFLGILLIIVGVQFFSVGLLGEMLVNNFLDEKEYNVKDKG
ncbi:MAG: glycosyltransferase family 2 protein [Ignavibacteriaceae bacterium]